MEQRTVEEPKPKCWYVYKGQIELTKYCTSALIPPLFLVLKMPSAFYVCCIYSSALQTRFFHGSKQGNCMIWVHSVCNLGYIRRQEEQTTNAMTGGLRVKQK